MRAYFLTRPGWLWIALFAVAAVVAFAAMPKGFFGGASDDWQYLNASRCWAAHGPCLPTDHWQGRWPAIVPTAALISVFGESRLTIAVWPMLSSAVALGLVIALGNIVVAIDSLTAFSSRIGQLIERFAAQPNPRWNNG